MSQWKMIASFAALSTSMALAATGCLAPNGDEATDEQEIAVAPAEETTQVAVDDSTTERVGEADQAWFGRPFWGRGFGRFGLGFGAPLWGGFGGCGLGLAGCGIGFGGCGVGLGGCGVGLGGCGLGGCGVGLGGCGVGLAGCGGCW